MFSHVMVGSDDLARSKQFYDAALAPLGIRFVFEDETSLWYRGGGTFFAVRRPLDGGPACSANGGTIGFNAADPEAANAFHGAAVAAGGTSCEDPPGWRDNQFGRMYLAYVRDPDGNKLCALHRPKA